MNYANHVLALGRTGKGKTSYFRDHVIPNLDMCVITIDVKQNPGDFLSYLGQRAKSPAEVAQLLNDYRTTRKNIYWPVQFTDYDNLREQANEVYDYALKANNCYIYNDELYPICDSHNIPPKLQMIMTLGRGRRVIHIGGTQRPTGVIHQSILSQTETFIYFKMAMKDINANKNDLPFVDKALELEDYHYIITDGETYTIEKPITPQKYPRANDYQDQAQANQDGARAQSEGQDPEDTEISGYLEDYKRRTGENGTNNRT